MKKLFFLVLLFSACIQAQIPVFDWAITLGDYQSGATSIAVDNVGNVYTTGIFKDTGDFDSSSNTFNLTANGANDFYVTKYDSSGNFIWAKNFGAIITSNTFDNDDQNIKLTLDTQGNLIFTGTFLGFGDFDPSAATAIISTSSFSGNYVQGNFILKLDSDANFIWVKKITAYLNCTGDSIFVDNDNEIYLTGNYVYTADLNPGAENYTVISAGSSNIYIVKLASNGDFIWGKSLGNSSGEEDNKTIKVDINKNVYLTGSFRNTLDLDPGLPVFNVISNGEKDAFFIKLNSTGDFQWGKSIGGQDNDRAVDISIDNSGNFFAIGVFAFDVDFDPGLSGFNIDAGAILTNYLLKLDTNGNFNWALKLGNSVKTPNVTNDLQGNIYFSSGFSSLLGPIDADPGPNVFNLSTLPDSDIYFAKLDTNANFIWAFNYGDGQFRETSDLLIKNDKIYYCGSFDQAGSQNLLDLNPFAGENGFDSITASYVVKLAQPEILNVEILSSKNIIHVYPNPTSTNLNLQSSVNLNNASLKIISLLGQTVFEKQNLSGLDFSFDVSKLSSGLYIIEITQKSHKEILKFIKD